MVRETLIDCATEMLFETGVVFAVTQIKLGDVMKRAGVARATAYRSLSDDDGDPQEALNREVLSRVLTRASRSTTHSAVAEAIAQVWQEQSDNINSDRAEDRNVAVRAIVRAGAAVSYHLTAESRERSILVAAYGSIKSRDDAAVNWQREQLRSGETHVIELFVELYRALTGALRFRLRPGFTMEQFATVGASLVEGMAMRSKVNDHLDGIMLPTGPDGDLEEWTLFAVAFEAIVHRFFELEI